MPKRYIGIDIGRSHVCAAQVVRTAEGFRVEKAFAMQTRRSSDSLPATLRALADEHGFDRRARAAVCLPLQAFFFADIETDAQGLEAIRASDGTALKDYFPIPAQEIVAQVCSVAPLDEGRSSVLVAASARAQLQEGLQSLRAGRIAPAGMDTPITAVHTTILTNHPEAATGLAVVLYVNSATLSLAVTQEGRLLLVRSIPMLSPADQNGDPLAPHVADIIASELEITWRRLFGSAPDPGLRLFLIAPAPMAEALASALQEKTDSRVIAVNPYAHVARSEDVETDLPICVAEGLALRALQAEGPGHIDFLAVYRARTQPKLRLTRELSICGGLAAAAIIVWVVGLFLQLSSLETSYGQLRKQIETVFREAVPEEQNIVDPLAQLQQRLDALRQERGLMISLDPNRPGPLEILDALSRSAPATASLRLQDVLIAADSVRVTGTCDSFTTLSEWQRQLEAIPGLRVVDVPRPTKDAQSGKVRFTISLSTEGSKA